MSIRTFLGQPPPFIKDWIIKHNPPYDAEVQWLQADGNSYIVAPNNVFFKQDNCRVELTMSIGNAALSSIAVLLAAGSSLYDSPYYFRVDTNSTTQLACPGANWWSLFSDGNVHTIMSYGKVNSQGYFVVDAEVDGELVQQQKPTTSSNVFADTIGIFASNNGQNACPAGERIYRIKSYDSNGDLVSDFVPVRFTNELGALEGALYDKVSCQLFKNAGTGAFVVGSDVGWTNPYVTDGLVAMWDGEWNMGGGRHDAGAAGWRDVVSGVDTSFAVGPNADAQAAGKSISQNGYEISGLVATVSHPGLQAAFNSTFYTIEAVVSFELPPNESVDDSRNYIIGNWRNGAYYQMWDKNGKQTSTPWQTWPRIGETTYMSLADSGGSRLQRLVSTTLSVVDNTVTVEEAVGYNQQPLFELIGSSYLYHDYSYYGTVYAIRVYNRALAAEELSANYAVDAARFGLPSL